MRWLNQFRFLVLLAPLFISTIAFAQSPDVDTDVLPTLPSADQVAALTYLTPAPICPPAKTSARQWHRAPAAPLTVRQLQYREAVRALGTDHHHLVHMELADGKVRTGAIIGIDDSGFEFRNGIIRSQHIEYSQLATQPYHVPAVGTHIANGFKWAGFGTGIGALFVLAIPAIIVFMPLAAAGVIQD